MFREPPVILKIVSKAVCNMYIVHWRKLTNDSEERKF
jgi:hypothetical protein